jgi:hypothetical protein
MARIKKNKSKKVRTWRDEPMTIIEPKKEYVVLCSGGQVQVPSDKEFEAFCLEIDEMVGRGLLVLIPEEDHVFKLKISKEQHFVYTVMTKRRFDRMRAEAQFAGMGGQQGRPQ